MPKTWQHPCVATVWNSVPLHAIENKEHRSPAASFISSTSISTSWLKGETALRLRVARAARRLASTPSVCDQPHGGDSEEQAVPGADSAATPSSAGQQHELIEFFQFRVRCLGQLCCRHGLLKISGWIVNPSLQ